MVGLCVGKKNLQNYIDKNQVYLTVRDVLPDTQLQKILEAADQNDDEKINFEEFVELAQKDDSLDLLLKETFK